MNSVKKTHLMKKIKIKQDSKVENSNKFHTVMKMNKITCTILNKKGYTMREMKTNN